MKKFHFFTLLFCIAFLTGCGGGGSGRNYEPADSFRYAFDNRNEGIVILRYTGTNLHVRIPSTIEDYPVVGIGVDAFMNTTVTNVTIPETVVIIGDNSFRNTSLSSINIPSNVERIGSFSFGDNSRLTTITINNESMSIPIDAFGGSDSISEDSRSRINEINPDAWFERNYGDWLDRVRNNR